MEKKNDKKEINCIICNASGDEATNLVGISYAEEENREDIFLCDKCIFSAHSVLIDDLYKSIEELTKEKNELYKEFDKIAKKLGV